MEWGEVGFHGLRVLVLECSRRSTPDHDNISPTLTIPRSGEKSEVVLPRLGDGNLLQIVGGVVRLK